MISYCSAIRAALILSLLFVLAIVPALALEGEPEFLLLEVRLDRAVLTGAMPALDNGEHVFLPLGELSRLLTIAISSSPEAGTASGFVVNEARSFSFNLNDLLVNYGGVTETVGSSLVISEPDDIYVAVALLEQWLPLDLDVDFSSLSLRVHPLLRLPVQEQLDRQDRSAGKGSASATNPGFSYSPIAYQWLSIPTIDQTLSWDYHNNFDRISSNGRYTAFVTGDLAGLEADAFLSIQEPESEAEFRLSLGRSDPDGRLLGPLQARSFRFGSLSSPAVANINPATSGLGVTVSNRPLTRPAQFDRHTFAGDLPPGWDVELYYNGVLVGYRQPGPDGSYQFLDQPLYYGPNNFRLVFNGPLGQRRIEKVSFNLAQSMVLPGQAQYNLALNQGDDGQSLAHLDFEVGIHRQLTLIGALTQAPVGEEIRQYITLGMRTYWQALSINSDWVQEVDGGSLVELGVQSHFNGVSINANHIQLNAFNSAAYSESSDPLAARSQLRLSGSMPLGNQLRLPLTATLNRDQYQSGLYADDASLKASSYLWGTALTNTINWRGTREEKVISGTIQANRRVRNMGLRAQLAYNLEPNPGLSSTSLSINQTLGDGYHLSLTADHSILNSHTLYSAAFNKNLGRYGLGLNASYAETGEHTLGAKVFVSTGRDYTSGNWQIDAKPKAGNGLISIMVFIDDNSNGILDGEEIPLEGVGFTVNGARHQARTDANGTAYLDNLPVRHYLDVSLDTGTLEDPQWHSVLPGTRVLLRPGRTASLEFPVEATSEIDGTVYLLSNETERGAGDVHLELLNESNAVVAETRTGWDGFYILPDVAPGVYWLRVNPSQLHRLSWRDSGIREIVVQDNGDYVSGMDMWVLSEDYRTFNPNPSQNYLPIEGYRTEPWIISQADGHYTIQIMAARNEALVQRFIDEHQLEGRLAYFESRYQGKPWFSVIYGSYGSYDEATAAMDSLPAPFAVAGPWVRSYSGIKVLLE